MKDPTARATLEAGAAFVNNGPTSGRCPHCSEPLALDLLPFTKSRRGVRVYTCSRCGREAAFYSAAWLSSTMPPTTPPTIGGV